VIASYLRLCWRSPRSLIGIVSGLTVLLCFFSFGKLDFESDREALFKASDVEIQKKSEFEERFGSWRDLVLVIDGGTAVQREALVQELVEQMARWPGVSDIRGHIELPRMESIGLYYLSPEELREVDQALADYGSLLDRMSRDGWYEFLAYIAERSSEQTPQSKGRERFARVWKQAVEGRGSGELDELFPHLDLPGIAYFTDGPDRHLISLHSDQPLKVQELVRESTVGQNFPGRLILTGQPLLQAEERRATIHDAISSTILAIVVVQLILIRGFRETARPKLAFLSLLFGLLWSVAWAAVSVGKLNIITINFLTIAVGLGIDFSIHILARYSEESATGVGSTLAMEQTLRTTGLENLVGALATALAFWALYLTDFLAVQQLGLITGVAVPLCFVSVVLTLPPLLFWREKSLGAEEVEPLTASGGWLEKVEMSLRARPKFWLGWMSVAMLGMLAVGSRVGFDYNLLNMQSAQSEAVRYEREGGFNSLAAFVVADSPGQARELKTRLEALPAVAEVQTVAEILPEQIEEKRELVASIVSRVGEISRPVFDPLSKPDWNRMQSLAEGLESGGKPTEWVTQLQDSGPGPVEDVWKQMQGHLKQELTFLVERLAAQDTGLDLSRWMEGSPALCRLANLDGATLLKIRARGSLWSREVLVDFLNQVEQVTERGVGPPFLIRNYLEQLRDSYFQAVRYAILAILFLLALHFRALTPTAVALVPKVAGAIGMFFAMEVAGIELNPANCMALPLTLGIGLVFGIHAVHRCLESPDALLIRGCTGKAITLSAVTTIASFGTLMTASHPGIFSLGFVMASGVAANMIATFLLVPPLVVLFRDRLTAATSA